MCLYPLKIRNPRYKPNKKNGGQPPKAWDARLLTILVPCGHCRECRKKKAREWKVRLEEEIKHEKAIFPTLTFSDESFQKLEAETGIKWKERPNDIARIAVRRFLERVRKETGKSLRHWFVTELGQDPTRTERLHFHGLAFGPNAKQLIEKHWKYGRVYFGEYVNLKTINYITKYILKKDLMHKDFEGKVFASPGLGKGYADSHKHCWAKINYKTIAVPTYTTKIGTKIALPKYFKDKIFSDYEREVMYLNSLEKGITYIGGEKVDAHDWSTINNLITFYRGMARNDFFDDTEEWLMEREKKFLEQRMRESNYSFQMREKASKRMSEIIRKRDFKAFNRFVDNHTNRCEKEEIVNNPLLNSLMAVDNVLLANSITAPF